MGSRPIISSFSSLRRATDGIQLPGEGRGQAYPKTNCSWEVTNPRQRGGAREQSSRHNPLRGLGRRMSLNLVPGAEQRCCKRSNTGGSESDLAFVGTGTWGTSRRFTNTSAGCSTENRLRQPLVSCKHDPCGWSWLPGTPVAPALSHLTGSWREPVNYKQGQLVRQAAIYSTSPFPCMRISLPSTAGLRKANEKEDETTFL